MRKVAAYALFSPPFEPENAEVRSHAVQAAVVQWRDGKGPLHSTERGLQLTLNKGRLADYAEKESYSDSGLLVDFRLIEPSGAARVQTQISIGLLAGWVVVYVEVQAAGDAYQLGPLNLDIRCPHIVRSLVEEYDDWQVGDSLVTARPLAFRGPNGALELEQVLWHPSRNLPVVVISDY